MKRALNAVAVRIRYVCCGFRQEAEHKELVTKGVDRNLEAPCYAAACVRRRDGDRRVLAYVIGSHDQEIRGGDVGGIASFAHFAVGAVLLVVQRYSVARLPVGIRVGPLHSVRDGAPRAVAVVCGNDAHKANVGAQRKQVVKGNGKACTLARFIKQLLDLGFVIQIDCGAAGNLGAVSFNAAGGAAKFSESDVLDQNVKYVVVIHRD